jgi:hypothetical protein
MSTTSETPVFAKPDAMLRVPLGLSSPLWGFFAGAAVGGAAFWWMTRWARPHNLEAMFGEAASSERAVEAPVEAVEPVVEAVVEAEIVAFTAPDAMVEGAAPEAAAEPFEPILEPAPAVEAAAAAPRPRVKKIAPKAD